MFRLRRLYWQLFLIGCLSTLVGLAVLVGHFVSAQARIERSFVEQSSATLAQGIASAVTEHLVTRDYWKIENTLLQGAASPSVNSIYVIDPNGNVLGGIHRGNVDAAAVLDFSIRHIDPPKQAKAIQIDRGESIDVWQPVVAGTQLGWVRIEFSLTQAKAFQSEAWRGLIQIGGISLVLGAGVLALLLRKPIAQLLSAAKFAETLPEAPGSTLPLIAASMEIESLQGALNRTSLKIHSQNAKLDEKNRQLVFAQGIYKQLARGITLAKVLRHLIEDYEQNVPDTLCSIELFDSDGKRVHADASAGLPASYCAMIESMEAADDTGVFRNERVIIEDIARHPDSKKFGDLAKQTNLASYWAEPIRSESGAILGTFAVYRTQPGVPNDEQLGLLIQASNIASIAIDHHRAEESLALASSVYTASSEAIVITDDSNRIIAVNPAFSRVTGYAPDEVIGQNPKILASGQTSQATYRDMWQALSMSGQWQGEIWNRRKNGDIYAEWVTINVIRNDEGRIFRYVAIFSDVTERKQAHELIWKQANYDTLTELPNRRLFRDRLQQELKEIHRNGASLALMFIDLDRFKEVNDSLGHDAGDELLRQAAKRIQGCVRDSDTVARLGGDEFTVLLPNVADSNHVDRVAQQIVHSLSQPFHLGVEAIYVSASIGITMAPMDGADSDLLMRNADQAMYTAKAHGRNRFRYFTQTMQDAAAERMLLGNDLRNALPQQQFELHFQPIIDLNSGRIDKAEALLRWRHPKHGLIPPGSFIPLAEELGLIEEIGDWVFKEAANKAKAWCASRQCPSQSQCTLHEGKETGTSHCGLRISINKSPRQFLTGSTHERWLDYLRAINLSPKCITIEITENLLLDERPEITEKLAQFRDAGIEIALDDFGTGYSALSYLTRYHIDILKIDQSFVRDMEAKDTDCLIIEAIIAMAHRLGILVVAEGVETEGQRQLLKSAGCDYIQGFLCSKPLPSAEFSALLNLEPGDA